MADSTTDLRRETTWSIVLSVLMIVAGLFAIGSPAVAGVAVTKFVGWLLLFSGFLHLGFAWRAERPATITWEILLGILYGVIGWYLIARPVAGLASLTVAVAVYLFIQGIIELLFAFQLRPAPGSGWLVFDSIVSVVLAALIWSTWPSSTVWVIGTLVGISVLFSGITRLMLSTAIRRIA